MLPTAQDSLQKTWKLAFFIFSAILLVVMPLLSHQYGQSGDEWLQIEYGRDIWEYFFNGNPQALNYDNKGLQYGNLHFYGGMFDFGTEILHRWFPSIPLLYLRHFFNALTGVFFIVFSGMFAYRLSGRNWAVGLIALLFMAFSPRIFGESMNNEKDIPFGCGFIIGCYYFLAILQDYPKRLLRNTIGLFIGFAIAFGVRPAGGLLLVVYFVAFAGLYYFFDEQVRNRIREGGSATLKKTVIFIIAALALGYVVGLLMWPYGLQSPISNPLNSLRKMANVDVTLRVFFEGVYRPNNNMPWYYELKWILISNPLIVIAGVGVLFVMVLKAKETWGWAPVLSVIFAAWFTPLYMIYKKSSVHDTWRHLFFIYPFWVSMSAMGISLLGGLISNPKWRHLPISVAIIGLLPAIIWTFRWHPNQYVYFNELVGGIRGAQGYYDTDYYQNSGLQHANWIRENIKPIPGRKIVVASNMLGFDRYFAKDSSWIRYYYVRYNDRHTKEWDYYVTYSRYISPEQLQNDIWPPKNAIHEVKVDGVTISATLPRPSTAGMEAYAALQKNDFATAAIRYAEQVQADPYDENVWSNYGIALASTGRLDEAINALNKAIALDGGNASFYQILAQVYQAKGDMNSAQQSMNTANAIMMRERENMEQ